MGLRPSPLLVVVFVSLLEAAGFVVTGRRARSEAAVPPVVPTAPVGPTRRGPGNPVRSGPAFAPAIVGEAR